MIAEGSSEVRRRGAAYRRLAALQIADPSADRVILRIAGGLPERSSYLVLVGDQGGYSTGAAAVQVLLTCSRQRYSNALSPMRLANGEPIHISPPPVPRGNQGTEDFSTTLGYKQDSWGIDDQTLDVIYAIRCACVLASRLGP
jgi:hypothetical protein